MTIDGAGRLSKNRFFKLIIVRNSMASADSAAIRQEPAEEEKERK